MGIRFIGHKKQLLPDIIEVISSTVDDDVEWVADLFTGTASVSVALKRAGYHVIANDILSHSCVSARALLLNSPHPQFDTLRSEVPDVDTTQSMFIQQGGYHKVLSHLNQLSGQEGFFYNHYSPEGTSSREEPRKYFITENAKKIDTWRATISQWNADDLLSEAEHSLLLYDVIRSANEVANTAGTYGAFLKGWYERAKQPIELSPSDIPEGTTEHRVYQRDANELASELKARAVYLDPPYTKRQYASYYHIPETIAEEDTPEIEGKTGLRPWQSKSSDYCYKSRAADSLDELLSELDAEYVFLSYSDEGHIPPGELEDILSEHGSVTEHQFGHQRYKSNNGAKSGELTESLYVVERNRKK